MSGLFKSFDRIVSAQVLAGTHRLLLSQSCFRYNPANYYFDPRLKYSGLQQGTSTPLPS